MLDLYPPSSSSVSPCVGGSGVWGDESGLQHAVINCEDSVMHPLGASNSESLEEVPKGEDTSIPPSATSCPTGSMEGQAEGVDVAMVEDTSEEPSSDTEPPSASGEDVPEADTKENQENIPKPKRKRKYKPIPANERCGTCHTCLNPQLRKACETRRREMQALEEPETKIAKKRLVGEVPKTTPVAGGQAAKDDAVISMAEVVIVGDGSGLSGKIMDRTADIQNMKDVTVLADIATVDGKDKLSVLDQKYSSVVDSAGKIKDISSVPEVEKLMSGETQRDVKLKLLAGLPSWDNPCLKAFVDDKGLVIFEKWISHNEQDTEFLCQLLDTLDKIPVSIDAIRKNPGFGRTLGRLRKHESDTASKKAKRLVKKWTSSGMAAASGQSGAARAAAGKGEAEKKTPSPEKPTGAGALKVQAKQETKEEAKQGAKQEAKQEAKQSDRNGASGPVEKAPSTEGTVSASIKAIDDGGLLSMGASSSTAKPSRIRSAIPQPKKTHQLQIWDAGATTVGTRGSGASTDKVGATDVPGVEGSAGGATPEAVAVPIEGDLSGSQLAAPSVQSLGPSISLNEWLETNASSGMEVDATGEPGIYLEVAGDPSTMTDVTEVAKQGATPSSSTGALVLSPLGSLSGRLGSLGSTGLGGTTRIGSSTATNNALAQIKLNATTAAARAAAAAARTPSPDPPLVRKEKAKKVSWAPETSLKSERVFKRDDPPCQVKQDVVLTAEELAQVHMHAPGFELAARQEHTSERLALARQHQDDLVEKELMEDRLLAFVAAFPDDQYRPPPLLLPDPSWHLAAGEGSSEARIQAERCSHLPKTEINPSTPLPLIPAEPWTAERIPSRQPIEIPLGAPPVSPVTTHVAPSSVVQPLPVYGVPASATAFSPSRTSSRDSKSRGTEDKGVTRGPSGYTSRSEPVGTKRKGPTDDYGRVVKHSTPCRFFNKPGGCRNGDQCLFMHLKDSISDRYGPPRGYEDRGAPRRDPEGGRRHIRR